MIDFHPFQVVGRSSETRLQVGENLNKLRMCQTFLLYILKRKLIGFNVGIQNQIKIIDVAPFLT